MDKYTLVTSDDKFSKLTLNVANFPKSIIHWENLLNYLINEVSPINKSIDKRIYKLIKSTYESILTYFPYLETYHIDYALLEFKLGHLAHVHKIFKNGLFQFNNKSLLIWLEYLKFCNQVISNNKILIKKYQLAESNIGLHFYSGEFWKLYLDQLNERCISKQKYFFCLRKILELPIYHFSYFYSIWLSHIDSFNDLNDLKLIISKDELSSKLKLDFNNLSHKRKGPELIERKKIIRKFTKELYTVIQYQVLQIHSLFESKLVDNQFYSSPETLVSNSNINAWISYLNYTINLNNDSLIELNFQRSLLPLAHYDIIWLKYANWFIDYKNDLLSAKNVLEKGLTFALKKTAICKMLYSILIKLNEFDKLFDLLSLIKRSYNSHIEDADDFEMFWDNIQFLIFLHNIENKNTPSNNQKKKSRYSNSKESVSTQNEIENLNENQHQKQILPIIIFDKIMKRLSYCEKKNGQEIILSMLIQLQDKENTNLIEENIFKLIIESNWKYYLNNGSFWYLYSRLIFLDPSRSYLDKRKYCINNVWTIAKKYNDDKKNQILLKLQEFCHAYSPEDLDELEDLF
ncbi:hypothetical protein TBLA_0A01740 [Henningerozyma blattae CBS 6284]|uniref:Uncharacterized protein n=1 Tax=Henningerozyma blattae (strain ATCC 34711 / CBS 6284 / DSM 70876 / NBRC 10599 / NRRL Y-10934 / UCD 77-7) TaxID=1071380 RepID=I2GV22_HENB6|nr:hypothetical protein TBLA_0A01740 [Tetrapisispora blattae CBS 6284]CCH57974.1 hypothetical protein TBLA_0A01740 [Tetrapisispora blattae CBS 6284]